MFERSLCRAHVPPMTAPNSQLPKKSLRISRPPKSILRPQEEATMERLMMLWDEMDDWASLVLAFVRVGR